MVNIFHEKYVAITLRKVCHAKKMTELSLQGGPGKRLTALRLTVSAGRTLVLTTLFNKQKNDRVLTLVNLGKMLRALWPTISAGKTLVFSVWPYFLHVLPLKD